MMKIYKWLFIVLFIPAGVSAQIDSTNKINDILLYKAFIDYGAEYYKIDDENSILEHHIVFQPFINDINILNIEFGLTHSFLDSVNAFSPADWSISYQRNFMDENYGNVGYQGHAGIIKLIVPTGRGEYLSGFNSWAIEPLIGFQWRVFTKNFISALQFRYNYNFGALPNKETRPDFFRAEYFFGFDNSVYLAFFEIDYRWINQNNSHTLFLSFEFGRRISPNTGLRLNLKPRILGEDFYQYLGVLGLYHFF